MSVNGFGETVTVQRIIRNGGTDTVIPMPPVHNSMFGNVLQQLVDQEDSMRGRRAAVERTWACARGEDIRITDRITRTNGDTYTVTSNAVADTVHPMSGTDLGIKKYYVRLVQAPRG